MCSLQFRVFLQITVDRSQFVKKHGDDCSRQVTGLVSSCSSILGGGFWSHRIRHIARSIGAEGCLKTVECQAKQLRGLRVTHTRMRASMWRFRWPEAVDNLRFARPVGRIGGSLL